MNTRDPDCESIARSLSAVRRRQRRGVLAGRRPLAEVHLGEVVDAVAASADTPTVADIARALTIDPSQASRRVRDAVAAGFIVRTVVQSDGRASGLKLSPAGRRHLRTIQRQRQTAIADATKDWTPDARHQLADLLERLLRDLTDVE